MRICLGLLLGMLVGWTAANGGDKAAEETRYAIAPDLKMYPQGTAKEALASVVKAVEAKRVDYVVAQLADPSFVDDRVKRLYGGRIVEQVDDTRAQLDPSAIKLLQRFLKDGTWREEKNRVVVQLKDEARRLSFKKDGDRWFMENAAAP